MSDKPAPNWLADVNPRDAMLQSKVLVGVDWLEDVRQIEESLGLKPLSGSGVADSNTALDATPAAPQMAQTLTPPAIQPKPLGHDPETGQILDSVAYACWQKAEALRRQKEVQQTPAISIAAVYLDAQRAIQEWVDADANKLLVADGTVDALRKCSSLLELMRRYETYGPVMQEKLWQRLFFLVDNRKKFYQASR